MSWLGRVRPLYVGIAAAVAALLVSRREAACPPQGAASSSAAGSSSLGLAMLDVARQDLQAAFTEHGSNAGPEIEELYLQPLGFGPGNPYCAAAMSSWLRRALSRLGQGAANVRGGGLAKAWRDQFKSAGAWRPAPIRAEDLAPGDVLVFDRSVPGDPSTSSRGHIAIVEQVGDSAAQTIEANASSFGGSSPAAVSRMTRPYADGRLLGRGRVGPAAVA